VKNFLKPDRHTHKDPEVRIASVKSLDVSLPESQSLLEKMATTDEDPKVRVVAIENIASVTTLNQLKHNQKNASSSGSHDVIVTAADSRIRDLLGDNEITEAEASNLLATQADEYVPLLAIYSSNASVRSKALSLAKDEICLLGIVEQSRFHDTRLAAADRLQNPENMKAALAASRSRDKVVAKQIQSKLDELAETELAVKTANEAVSNTLDQMHTLSTSVWSPHFNGRVTAVSEKWNALDNNLRAPHETAFAVSLQKANDVIAKHDEEEASKKAQEASLIKSAAQDASGESDAPTNKVLEKESNPVELSFDDETLALCETLKQSKIADLEAVQKSAALSGGRAAGEVAQKLLAHSASISVLFNPPYDLAKGRPSSITERIKRVETLLKTDAVLPGIAMSEYAYMIELKQHNEALVNRLDKAKQESLDRAKATHRQFSALSATITDGKWGPANSMFRRLNKKVDAMEAAERSQFADKIARAEKQLDEMADWQDFAARPKLEALCTDMEALPAKELKPEALAKEIKSLQAQWKSLGVSRAANDLWARFKTAGDTAFEPCKVHFEEKQAARDTKIAAKNAICEQLEKQVTEADWDAPDWKAVQRLFNNAKRDWSRNRVSDRKPDKQLEKRFSDALKPIEEKLKSQYEINIAEKRDLIEKIQKLAEADINQHSANQAKRLQNAWKQAGIVPRKEDQALWEEFNGHCKTVFKHQHEARQEKYQASMSHVFRAREIIKTLRKMSKSAETDEQQIQALQTEFQALEAFPDKDKKFLLRDFRGAVDACARKQETASKQRAQAAKKDIERLVELCEQVELVVETSAPADNLIDDLTHSWDAVQSSVARDTLSKLTARKDAAVKHLQANSKFDYDANETLRRKLLIQMEILADKETPAEDKALRMQYQLEQLSEGMTSSAVLDKQSVLKQLEIDWYASPPAKQSVKDSLQSRFLAATSR